MSGRPEPTARRGTPPGWPCAHVSVPELSPGAIVGEGRLVVGLPLGRGGMATVYRSHDRRLGRDVALKVMLGDPARHRGRAARFEHEAELWARLPAHPCLVRLLHAGRLPELAERPYLAVELVEGPTLAFRLASDLRMTARGSVGVGLGLAQALAAVHGVGVVHRDVTARNVMLRGGGDERAGEAARPVLVDFGMAAALDPGASRLTRPDQRPGTVTAMAPEQYLGRPAHPAMDVYALGRLLYEMLTAEDPHATVSPAQLMERHRQGIRVAPRLAGRSDAGPAELRALVDVCLEPEPARRPTADDAAAELQAIARALERGATVLPFTGSGPPRAAVGRSRRSPSPSLVGAQDDRERWWSAWWSLGLASGVVGVVLGLVAGGLAGAPEPGSSGISVASLGDEPEPVTVVWPSTVVPVVWPEPVRDTPSFHDTKDANRESHVAAPPSRAVPTPVSRCDEARTRALAAARRWDWSEVLLATADRACWPEPGERTRLRLTAWIEQQRFDACAAEGADVREPALVRLVERCRQRSGPRETQPGGSP